MLLSHFADEEPEVREGVRLSQSRAAWSRASNAVSLMSQLCPTQALTMGEEEEGLIGGAHVNHSWTNRNFGEQTVSSLATPLGPAAPRPSWAHTLPAQPGNHPLPCLPSCFQPGPIWSVSLCKHLALCLLCRAAHG